MSAQFKSGDRAPFNAREDELARRRARETRTAYPLGDARAGRRKTARGRAAVEQARLIMLVMINVAQLWILAATVEAALAHHYRELVPLVVASGVCWLISLSIILWWRPASRRHTSTGYLRGRRWRKF
ncbi:MAG TPA: hypothetical protein VFA21_03970 [Pyrinomonadaceae bacterium]|jgi:hypothetical protein|nr:hypothetical protein [Pyrinomonadaceae bacterium]